MRIVAGKYGGRKIQAPSGDLTRPTADRVREALFSALGPVDDLSVLDLFAGTGALGIEALSRGADTATFVEKNAHPLAAIEANLSTLGVEGAKVIRRDVLAYLKSDQLDRRFDLVFVDPPYRMAGELSEPLSATLPTVLTDTARVVCESDRREPLDLNLNLQWERRYGDTVIKIYEPS